MHLKEVTNKLTCGNYFVRKEGDLKPWNEKYRYIDINICDS
jgi:hypothetical protein